MADIESNARHVIGISGRRMETDRRAWRFALLGSFVVHVLLFTLWPSAGVFVSPFAAAGARNEDELAAAGGLQSLNVRTPTPRPIIPPLIPLPVTTSVELDLLEEELQLETVEILGEEPGDPSPGVVTGEGRGDGGNASGGLFRLLPPSPRGMIIPPAHPSLKNKRIEVWVFVDARGRVVADSTSLRPPTDNRDLNRRLIREAAEWIFSPAKKGGEAVAAWFPYTISTGRE